MRYFYFEEEHPFSLIVPLIEEGKLDPWQVDIVELANLYLEELRKKESLDIRIPARAIVAAAFLLKKKVEVLLPKPLKKSRRRCYSLQEIVKMFEEECEAVEQELAENVKKIRRVLKRNKVRRRKDNASQYEKELPLHISKFEDILEEMWEFFKGLDVGTRLKFFTLLDKRNFVPQVMALLYLDYDNRIRLYQEEPFGELEIEILET